MTLVLNANSGDALRPRFRTLTGGTIYDANGNPQVSALAASVPGVLPTWADWTITLDQTLDSSHYGNDYIAGGAANDEIFGQLGNDTIQGDGSILTALTGNHLVGAARDANNGLVLFPSFEAASDGDDYIEGNGGTDVIFGGLGQDDIIGGSSSLFSLTDPSLRPDGTDFIFGGAGTRVDRNNFLSTSPGTIVVNERHARDSDAIAGDNANVYRLVAAGGGFLQFNYDQTSASEDRGARRVIVRAVQLLDYTPGGPSFNSTSAAGDQGARDEITANPETTSSTA